MNPPLHSIEQPRTAISGGGGFLGWHVKSAFLARFGFPARTLSRESFADPENLRKAVSNLDSLIHLAFDFNSSPERMVEENLRITSTLINALNQNERKPHILLASSIHEENGGPYGEVKRMVSEQLSIWASHNGVTFSKFKIPYVFGEHAVPYRNSVFGTFCRNAVLGLPLVAETNRPLPFILAQDLADHILDWTETPSQATELSSPEEITISELAEKVTMVSEQYSQGHVANSSNSIDRTVQSSLISHLMETGLPPSPGRAHLVEDDRGQLSRVVSMTMGGGEVFYSSTEPGYSRGHHFHRRKFERFTVVNGTALIRMKKLFSVESFQIQVSAEDRISIDMPTMWLHSIEPVGNSSITTVFFSDKHFDPVDADTYWYSDGNYDA